MYLTIAILLKTHNKITNSSIKTSECRSWQGEEKGVGNTYVLKSMPSPETLASNYQGPNCSIWLMETRRFQGSQTTNSCEDEASSPVPWFLAFVSPSCTATLLAGWERRHSEVPPSLEVTPAFPPAGLLAAILLFPLLFPLSSQLMNLFFSLCWRAGIAEARSSKPLSCAPARPPAESQAGLASGGRRR